MSIFTTLGLSRGSPVEGMWASVELGDPCPEPECEGTIVAASH